MEEHHGIKDHYWPSPLTVLAGFGASTSKITLGTDVVVLPFHHPVKAAEDAAMVDVISNGRLTLGVAIGYRPDELALFGVVPETRGARFVGQVTIMRRHCTEHSVAFESKFLNIQNARMEPQPVQQGVIPIWLGAWGPLGM